MANLIRFIKVTGGIILLAVLHIGFSYLLPYPFSKLNIMLAVLLLILLWKKDGTVVWIAFFTNFFIELYATTPFGIILFSSTISVLIGYWFYQLVFTDRSWYAAIGLTFFTLSCYRFLYLVLLFLASFFFPKISIPWQLIFPMIFWELLFTTLTVGLLYLIISPFNKKQMLI